MLSPRDQQRAAVAPSGASTVGSRPASRRGWIAGRFAPTWHGSRSLVDFLVSAAILVVLWELMTLVMNPVLLPGPADVLAAARELLATGSLIDDALITLVRVIVGYAAGVLAGILAGVAIGRVPIVSRYLEPMVGFIRTIPPVAIIPLAIIWFGIGEMSKYFVVFYGTAFVVLFNAADAARSVPRTRTLAASCLGASRWQMFRDVVAPSMVPGIWTGMKTAVGFSFMAVVAAELIAATTGIGNLIMQSRILVETDKMFVGLAVLAILGGAADRLFAKFGSRVLGRYLGYLDK